MESEHTDLLATAAYEAASAVVHYMHEPDAEEGNAVPAGWWPSLGETPETDDDNLDDPAFLATVKILAPFVRENPTAPIEALYRHARAHKVHTGDAAGWLAIPLAYRLAYTVFHGTLLAINAGVKAEAEMRRAQDPRPRPARFVDPEDTILEREGSSLEKIALPRRRAAVKPAKQEEAKDVAVSGEATGELSGGPGNVPEGNAGSVPADEQSVDAGAPASPDAPVRSDLPEAAPAEDPVPGVPEPNATDQPEVVADIAQGTEAAEAQQAPAEPVKPGRSRKS